MADNNREMHKIDEALYFVMKKNNQVELTDHGIKFLSGDTDSDFYSSRYWTEIATIEKKKLEKTLKQRKRKTIPRFRYKK
jgi:preprotein translocase subunit SecA